MNVLISLVLGKSHHEEKSKTIHECFENVISSENLIIYQDVNGSVVCESAELLQML